MKMGTRYPNISYPLAVNFTHEEEQQLIAMLQTVAYGYLSCFELSGHAQFARDFLKELGEDDAS